MLAPMLWVGTDILAGMLWKGYSFISQAISELSAVGAPTRPLVAPLIVVYLVLVIAFGLGVWRYASRNRALHVTGGLLIVSGLLGLASTPFSMHLGEAVSSPANTMHSIFAGVGVIFFLLIIGFGAVAYRNWFRFYSIGTLLTLLVAGVVSFGLAAAQGGIAPPQWFGLIERINAYGYMLWMAVLSIVLLREEERTSTESR